MVVDECLKPGSSLWEMSGPEALEQNGAAEVGGEFMVSLVSWYREE